MDLTSIPRDKFIDWSKNPTNLCGKCKNCHPNNKNHLLLFPIFGWILWIIWRLNGFQYQFGKCKFDSVIKKSRTGKIFRERKLCFNARSITGLCGPNGDLFEEKK